MRMASVIVLSAEVQATLLKWSRSRKVATRLVQRAKIVLLAAEGLQNKDIAQQLKTDPGAVSCWRRRSAAGGLEAIEKEASGRGRAPSPKLVSKILEKNTKVKPPGGATHWSTLRHWEPAKTPHRTKTFKVSNNPKFEEKLREVVGR